MLFSSVLALVLMTSGGRAGFGLSIYDQPPLEVRVTPSAPLTTSTLFIGIIDSRIFPGVEFADWLRAAIFVVGPSATWFVDCSLTPTFVAENNGAPPSAGVFEIDFASRCLIHNRIPP